MKETAAPAPSSRVSNAWRSVREAIRGTHQDFTEGSIGRGIVLLAIPMVLEMLMESLFAVVDIFFVAQLGANAAAAVGLTEAMLTLMYSVAIGLSMAITAMVARRIGEKDHEGAAIAAVQAILLGAAVAAVVGVAGVTFAPRMLELMGGPPDLVNIGYRYTAIIFGGSITVMLLFLNNGIFRGAGDAAIAMRVLWLSNIINIVLDPCLILGLGPFPKMGVTGAAVATVIGRGTGVLYQLWLLFAGDGRVRLARRHLRVDFEVMRRLVRVSATGILQFVIAHVSWIFLVRIVSAFGSFAVAGYTIAIRIFVFAILPSWGLSGAAATMVGQNLGAHKPERSERAVWITGWYNMLFLAAVAVAFIAVPEPIVRFFTDDDRVIPFAVDCLRILSFGNIAYAYGMVMVQAFNGAGDTVTPTVINFFGFWLLEIPLAWALAIPADLGPAGVFISIPIAEAAITIAAVVLFRRGAWKAKRI